MMASPPRPGKDETGPVRIVGAYPVHEALFHLATSASTVALISALVGRINAGISHCEAKNLEMIRE
jgi:hypothetical protein